MVQYSREDLVTGRVPLLIELKDSGKVGPLESRVASLLRTYRGLARLLLSFSLSPTLRESLAPLTLSPVVGQANWARSVSATALLVEYARSVPGA